MKRRGFTLVELLVVITILMIMASLVIAIFGMNTGSRMSDAARQVQATFMGAKDRALFAKDFRGVRFVRDDGDANLIRSLVYIQPMQTTLIYKRGATTNSGTPVQVRRPDVDGNNTADSDSKTIVQVTYYDTSLKWTNLYADGFMPTPCRIRVPADSTGAWYTFWPSATNPQAVSTTVERITLFNDVNESGSNYPAVVYIDSDQPAASCELKLANELLPNHLPISLSSSIVIDLRCSGRNDFDTNVLTAFDPSNTGDGQKSFAERYGAASTLEFMFSPRGMLDGDIAALGPLYFVLRDIQDTTEFVNPADEGNQVEAKILTLYPQTGHVATYAADPTDADGNGYPDDLFSFAKRATTGG